jgi:hypothetical protein
MLHELKLPNKKKLSENVYVNVTWIATTEYKEVVWKCLSKCYMPNSKKTIGNVYVNVTWIATTG